MTSVTCDPHGSRYLTRRVSLINLRKLSYFLMEVSILSCSFVWQIKSNQIKSYFRTEALQNQEEPLPFLANQCLLSPRVSVELFPILPREGTLRRPCWLSKEDTEARGAEKWCHRNGTRPDGPFLEIEQSQPANDRCGQEQRLGLHRTEARYKKIFFFSFH